MSYINSIIEADAKTQKAQGVRLIARATRFAWGSPRQDAMRAIGLYFPLRHPYLYTLLINVKSFLNAADTLDKYKKIIAAVRARLNLYTAEDLPAFFRPCPTVPRHGFVDSRQLALPYTYAGDKAVEISAGAIKNLFLEVQQADPEGEVLIQPYIPVVASSILTPTTLSIGAGNDGATAGKSFTLHGPHVVLDNSFQWNTTLQEEAGISDTPYAEFIWPADNDARVSCVQLRNGPAVQAESNYIPVKTQITSVLRAYGNLLTFEKLISEAGPGTVVYAPGQSLTSHYCVHAILHKIPVITDWSKRPEVGETLTPESPEANRSWSGHTWRKLAHMIADVEASTTKISQENCLLGLSALHLSAYWATRPAFDPALWLLANGLVHTAYALSSAVLGELRHCSSGLRSRNCRDSQVLFAFRITANHGWPDRSAVYRKTLKFPLSTAQKALEFAQPVWRGEWSRNYGGQAWGNISRETIRLLSAVKTFRKRPNAKNWAKVVSRWNSAIHEEHNGNATALQKYGVYRHHMDAAADWPLGLLNSSLSRDMVVRLIDLAEHGYEKRPIQYRDTKASEVRAETLVNCLSTWIDRHDYGSTYRAIDHIFLEGRRYRLQPAYKARNRNPVDYSVEAIQFVGAPELRRDKTKRAAMIAFLSIIGFGSRAPTDAEISTACKTACAISKLRLLPLPMLTTRKPIIAARIA